MMHKGLRSGDDPPRYEMVLDLQSVSDDDECEAGMIRYDIIRDDKKIEPCDLS